MSSLRAMARINMKPIDKFNRFMGRLTVDATELLIIPLKDVLDIIQAIKTILALLIRSITNFRAELKVQFVEQHGENSSFSEVLLFQFKKLVELTIGVNKKILISVFYSAARHQPLIPIVFTIGSISWIWHAVQTQNFLMGVLGLVPMFMVFTSPVGLWYLVFG